MSWLKNNFEGRLVFVNLDKIAFIALSQDKKFLYIAPEAGGKIIQWDVPEEWREVIESELEVALTTPHAVLDLTGKPLSAILSSIPTVEEATQLEWFASEETPEEEAEDVGETVDFGEAH